MNLSPIKPKLERMTCSEHGEHPTITIKKDGLDISCCCESFKKKLTKQAEVLIAEDAKNEITRTLNNAFNR